MNSLNWGNVMWPDIPNLQQIKDRLVANVYYIVSKTNDWKDKIKVRVWQKWESEQSKTYDIQNYIDKVWSETQMILDVLEKKEEFLKSKVIKESLFSNTGSTRWIHIIEKRSQLTFLIHLDNWKESKESTKKINQENFETIFYWMIEKFLNLRKELWMNNLSNNEIIKLTSYIDYYKKEYENKLTEKKYQEEKKWLIENWLVSKKWKILSINNYCYGKSIINNQYRLVFYKKNWEKLTKRLEAEWYDEIIKEYIKIFASENNINPFSKTFKWLMDNKTLYSIVHKNKEQKNSNFW